MKRLPLIIALAAALPVVAWGASYKAQKELTTDLATATDASFDCDATTDITDATRTTATVTCANTGSLVVAGYKQFTIDIVYVYNSGSVVNMQCDRSIRDNQASPTWLPVMIESATGEKTIRTWKETTAASTSFSNNFEINATLLRCRLWVTGGAAADTVQAFVSVAAPYTPPR